ncbi:rhamnogalacturonan acetylesterase [Pontibacter pamirensis]|uniref:rhamnogalacturonan acetylesterase n=1 Tax=Pontibacter pamirensis TaxID=2562824 RepID=UPI001F179420|nr:GDSL-type esterase/lipase family protein [Pontibacter pamirensis]
MRQSVRQPMRHQFIRQVMLSSTICCFLLGCKTTKTDETGIGQANAQLEANNAAPQPSETPTTPDNANAETAQAILKKFDFGSGEVQPGYQQITPATIYTKERGYGIISKSPVQAINREGADALRSDFVTSQAPFYFAVDLPEGNYEVTVLLGDLQGISNTTVKAESRRLMLEEVQTPSGKVESHTFTVNVRTPRIGAEESIRLKPRENVYLNWDDKLTLEFNNSRPCVAAIEIREVNDVISMYLAGNSTVVDQEFEPWAAWGQMIPRFFKPGVVVTNYAESGESLKAFVGEKRLAKILSVIKPNDYLFIEFAHNDQKPGSSHVEPFTTYKDMLKHYISEARKRGAIPVLVTSMHRRNFDEQGKIINTLGDYPEAVRQTAKEEQVALVDLNAMSKEFYEAMGPEKSKKAFVHYPAGTFPGQDTELEDNTHFSTYGAYQLARGIVEGIKKNNLKLADYLRDDVKPFDPANPDPVEKWQLPQSPDVTAVKPDGS